MDGSQEYKNLYSVMQYESVCIFVMMPVNFGTLMYLGYFSVRTGTVWFYARLLFALLILLTSYVLNLVWIYGFLPGRVI
jgi:hypothetical protein